MIMLNLSFPLELPIGVDGVVVPHPLTRSCLPGTFRKNTSEQSLTITIQGKIPLMIANKLTGSRPGFKKDVSRQCFPFRLGDATCVEDSSHL